MPLRNVMCGGDPVGVVIPAWGMRQHPICCLLQSAASRGYGTCMTPLPAAIAVPTTACMSMTAAETALSLAP
eukprot:356123-Chlamydomonas_euryale.AAC.5